MNGLNGETYLKDMLEWKEETIDTKTLMEQSEIIKFYDGCNILMTGGSGFVGKLLVERLLRSCRKIQKIYLLMRAKKGKTPEERFKEHFEDIIYCRLKQEVPNFMKRIVLVEAEMGENGLGLTPENRKLIMDSNIIFHAAATVRFDEPLRFAVNVNVRGTREILLLAKEMPNLKAFVHIGTAFSQCVTKLIDEVFYEPPFGADKLLNLLDILDDEQLKIITPSIVGDWPNTYAFTKAVAEEVVRKYSTGIPTCVLRPSIMIATEKEPITAWINNLYGPTGVVAGAGVGLLRTLHCERDFVADIIPADYVINNIIAAPWGIERIGKLEENNSSAHPSEIKRQKDPMIFNSVSSCQNPVTWGEFMKWSEIFGTNVPSILAMWCYSFRLTNRLWVHNLYVIFLHLLPAVIIDALSWMIGRKPMLLDAYRKIHKFSHVISYFSTQQWRFRNDTVMKLWNQLNPADKKLFYFNVANFNWDEYLLYQIRGLRVFLIKDSMDTVPQARIKYRRFQIAHYILLTLLWLFAMWLACTFSRYIFSMFW